MEICFKISLSKSNWSIRTKPIFCALGPFGSSPPRRPTGLKGMARIVTRQIKKQFVKSSPASSTKAQ
ncbi:hypothetical protein VTI28DRAFT_6460 [Corynascus sepedonium]